MSTNFENGNLPPGDYCLLITDAAGCVATSACFVIKEVETLDLLFIVTEDCGGNGTIEVTVIGGTAPYNYDWEHLTPNPGSDPSDLTELTAGEYNLLVTDANGCTIQEEEVTVPNCDNPCDLFNMQLKFVNN